MGDYQDISYTFAEYQWNIICIIYFLKYHSSPAKYINSQYFSSQTHDKIITSNKYYSSSFCSRFEQHTSRQKQYEWLKREQHDEELIREQSRRNHEYVARRKAG